MHTKPVDKWKAFWRGFASANPYASLKDNPRIARRMAISHAEAVGEHWKAVGNHMRSAMRDFDYEQRNKKSS